MVQTQCAMQVVYNRLDGRLNETIVYEDAAIRPVYLIIFAT